MWLELVWIALAVAVLGACRGALACVLFWEEDATRDMPDRGFDPRRHHWGRRQRAVRTLWLAAALWFVLCAYTHRFAREHGALVAARDAAREQPPPPHCEGNNADAPAATWWEALVGVDELAACVAYKARTQASTVPNPGEVWALLLRDVALLLVEALGRASHLLLASHGYVTQLLLLLLVPAAGLVWLAMRGLVLSFSPPSFPRRRAALYDVEDVDEQRWTGPHYTHYKPTSSRIQLLKTE